jgi:hypothetical protein
MDLDTNDLRRAQKFVRTQAGDPYVWAAQGPNGFDCSGFMSAVVNVLFGRPDPFVRLFGTGNMSAALPGLGFQRGVGDGNDFAVGWSTKQELGDPECGHTAGTLAGVNVESRGGVGVLVGPAARGATERLFRHQMHLPISSREGQPPAPVLKPMPFPGVLRGGASGADVKLLQAVLRRCGAPLQGLGTYGPKTERHVRLFQAHRGMPATGVVDKATWDRLMAYLRPPKTALHRVGRVGVTLDIASLALRFAEQYWRSTDAAATGLMRRRLLELNPGLHGQPFVPGGFPLKVPTTR